MWWRNERSPDLYRGAVGVRRWPSVRGVAGMTSIKASVQEIAKLHKSGFLSTNQADFMLHGVLLMAENMHGKNSAQQKFILACILKLGAPQGVSLA